MTVLSLPPRPYIIYRRGKRTFSLTHPFASACLLRESGGKEERVPCTSLQRLFYVIASKIACQTCLDGDFSVPQRPAVPFSECKITDFLRTDQGVGQLFFQKVSFGVVVCGGFSVGNWLIVSGWRGGLERRIFFGCWGARGRLMRRLVDWRRSEGAKSTAGLALVAPCFIAGGCLLVGNIYARRLRLTDRRTRRCPSWEAGAY